MIDYRIQIHAFSKPAANTMKNLISKISLILILNLLSVGILRAEPQLNVEQVRSFKVIREILEQQEKRQVIPRSKRNLKELLSDFSKLLDAKAFIKIDTYLDEVATEQGHAHTGVYFYQVLTDWVTDDFKRTDLFKQWRDTTGSAHAYGFSAHHSIGLAWRSRGNQYGVDVTQKGWVGFGKHLEQAKSFADKSIGIEAGNIAALGAKIVIAMGASEGVDVVEKHYLEAIKHHPKNGDFFKKAAFAHLPRWGASALDYQNFHKKHGVKAPCDSATILALLDFVIETIEWNPGGRDSNTIEAPEVTDSCRRLLKIWVNFYTDDEYPYQAIGWRLYKNNGFKISTEISSLGLGIFPEDGSLLRLAGQSNYYTGNLEQSQDFLKKAEQIEPANPDLIFFYGQTLYRMKKWAEALPYLKKATKIISSSEKRKLFDATFAAGVSASRLGQLKTAKLFYTDSLKTGEPSQFFKVSIELGFVALNENDRKTAKKHFERALELKPSLSKWIANEPKLKGWQEW